MSKSPSLRRIQADIRELALEPSDRYHAQPLENDMFEWHFTIRGADGTDFEGGVYHGRIILPPEYPFKPPHILFLTQSGRFEINTKVCLSFSAYHPELWQPAWGIRLILEALISFLPTPADGAIGALDWTSSERKKLAKQSVDYFCPTCNKKAIDLLPELDAETKKKAAASNKFQKEIEQLQNLQSKSHGHNNNNNTDKTASLSSTEQETTTTTTAAGGNGGDASTASTTTDGSRENASATTESGEKETINNKKDKDEEIVKANQDGDTNSDANTTRTTSMKEEQKSDDNKPSPSNDEKKEQLPSNVETAAATTEPSGAQDQETTPPPPPPPPATAAAAAEAAAAVPVAAPAAVTNENNIDNIANHENTNYDIMNSYMWVIDPILQIIIVLLAIICYLFIRKFQVLMEELNSL